MAHNDMTQAQQGRPVAELPATGYIRQARLIGELAVSPEQAAENKARGKGPRRARAGAPPIVPVSSATLWRMVKSGSFPAPQKISGISGRVTAWKCEAVRRWLEGQENEDARISPVRKLEADRRAKR